MMRKKVQTFAWRLKQMFQILRYGKLIKAPRSPMDAITVSEVSEARRFFPLDKFFIFGHARSGTTLLTRLIRLHPEIYCNYQGHFFTRQPTLEGLVNRVEIEEWLTRTSNRWNRGHDLSPAVLRAVTDFIMEREARPLGVKVVGDKSPNTLLNGEAVRLAHKTYPDGKILFIVRDGRDVAVSRRFHAFIEGTKRLSKKDWEIRADFERAPAPFLRGERSIFTRNGIRTAAAGWAKNVRETDRLGREIFGDQYISLRYEDLLAQPWGQTARLWAFLNVDTQLPELRDMLNSEFASNPDKDWQQKKAGDLVSVLQRGKAGSWRDLFTERDATVFRDVAGEVLDAWGYK